MINHIIIQAGGKGTRMGHLTENKPKALVPVRNLPMIFHLFRKYPDKRYIIIADYKKDVLREYLAGFAEVKYQIVDAEGDGTCAGIRKAARLLPDNEPFMLVWCDLILSEGFELPLEPGDYIGISQTFTCRWSYRNGVFIEECSDNHGVAGLFIFKDKTRVGNVPDRGELVRWMQGQGMHFRQLSLAGTCEFGVISEYEALEKEKCRPFNKLIVDGDTLIKEPIDEQGVKLARLERKWYEVAAVKGVSVMPRLLSIEPLKMERIQGRNIYEYTDVPLDKKRLILRKVIEALKCLHDKEWVPPDTFSLKEAYFGKTMSRLSKIRDMVPFSDRKIINVNGRECRNIYYYKRDLERKLHSLRCDAFAFIHGDCTFSNIMLKNDEEPVFIDPRGYFGYTEIYGDPNYDWAKLYYSLVGNYDRFNLKDFRLTIEGDFVNLEIESNKWEGLERYFFEMSGVDPMIIKLLHAVIWLSLTTYSWHDYDSVCGAFYNGLFYLEEVL